MTRSLTATKPVSFALLILGAVIILASVGTLACTLIQRPMAIFLALFELPVVAAGVFVILLARGKVPQGRAVGLLCMSGAVAAPSFLGYISVNGELLGKSLNLWLLAWLAMAAVLALLACAEVIARAPGMLLRRIGLGLACGIPFAAGVAAFMSAGVRDWFRSLDALIQVLGVLGIFFVLLASVCAATHYIITAVIRGVEIAERQEDAA